MDDLKRSRDKALSLQILGEEEERREAERRKNERDSLKAQYYDHFGRSPAPWVTNTEIQERINAELEQRESHSTAVGRDALIRRFVSLFGQRPPSDAKVEQINEWLADEEKWLGCRGIPIPSPSVDSQPTKRRRSLPPGIRWAVLRRDNFKCIYCGARGGPEGGKDIVLHVDHIIPVSKGGTDDITNLATSCEECNVGKRDEL